MVEILTVTPRPAGNSHAVVLTRTPRLEHPTVPVRAWFHEDPLGLEYSTGKLADQETYCVSALPGSENPEVEEARIASGRFEPELLVRMTTTHACPLLKRSIQRATSSLKI